MGCFAEVEDVGASIRTERKCVGGFGAGTERRAIPVLGRFGVRVGGRAGGAEEAVDELDLADLAEDLGRGGLWVRDGSGEGEREEVCLEREELCLEREDVCFERAE